ncbi:MAG: ABC transporter ATP-binding protein [bacterium]
MDNIIRAEDLRKEFSTLVAVDGISFQVRRGECFGILGPNGAGKTSIIRMIYGFSPMTAGRLFIFGKDIRHHAALIKARLGVCQQENSLDPDLTVKENLEVFASYFNIPKGIARQRAVKLLHFNALEHRAKAKVGELSGGIMRRLVLARALINEPELLILDEPTTGLDPQARHQIWERLERLKSQGMTILLTTHYMDEASRLCDRLIIIDHGKILVEGRPTHLIQEHVGHNVLEIGNPSPQILQFLKEHEVPYENLGHRLIIHDHSHKGLFHAFSTRHENETWSQRMATLEDVFLKLTGRQLRE